MDKATAQVLGIQPRALNEEGAARYIGRSVFYLRDARLGRTKLPGPKFLRVGRNINYLVEELDAWLDSFR